MLYAQAHERGSLVVFDLNRITISDPGASTGIARRSSSPLMVAPLLRHVNNRAFSALDSHIAHIRYEWFWAAPADYPARRRGAGWQCGQLKLELFMKAARRIVRPHRGHACPARP